MFVIIDRLMSDLATLTDNSFVLLIAESGKNSRLAFNYKFWVGIHNDKRKKRKGKTIPTNNGDPGCLNGRQQQQVW